MPARAQVASVSAEPWMPKVDWEKLYSDLSCSASSPQAVVSACLLGWSCRYDGRSKPQEDLRRRYSQGELVPICPEVQGGLPTPRIPAGLQNGAGREVWLNTAQVVNREGCDVTAQFKKGARVALAVAQRFNLHKAILKQHSPSCGCGSFGGADGQRHKGDGVTCALLKENGIAVEAAGE